MQGLLLGCISEDLALLAALHAVELEADTLLELKEISFPEGLGMRLQSAESQLIQSKLSEVVASWPRQPKTEFLDSLAADFAAIYLNAQIGASPSESYWLDEDHLVMQKPMFQVRERYQEHGMVVGNWRDRADDHLVNELNFLAKLIKSEQSGTETLASVACFLDEHLLRWIGQFAERVATYNRGSDFYTGLALLSAMYCEELRDILAVILDEPRPTAEELEARLREEPIESVSVAAPQIGAGPTW